MLGFLRKETRFKLFLRRVLPLSWQDMGHYTLLVGPEYLREYFRNKPLIRSPLFYETHIAPFIAIHGSWFLWPVYRLLKAFNICFVINIWDSTGHTIAEMDQYARRLRLQKVDPRRRYVMVRKVNRFSRAIADLYRNRFWCLIINDLVYDLFLPITIRYRDLVLDSGLSRLKIQLREDLSFEPPPPRQRYLHQLPKRGGFAQWVRYFAMRSETPFLFPLREGLPEDRRLMRLLGGRRERLALFHYKNAIGNATARPTDPTSYFLAMEYLLDHGYRLVLAGREPMLDEFRRYPIIDYSCSGIASYKRDILLFAMASVAITGGSGVGYLADCLGTPYVYLNSWHVPLPQFSPYTVAVPTTLQDLTGRWLSFREQIGIISTARSATRPFRNPSSSPATPPATRYLQRCRRCWRSNRIFAP